MRQNNKADSSLPTIKRAGFEGEEEQPTQELLIPQKIKRMQAAKIIWSCLAAFLLVVGALVVLNIFHNQEVESANSSLSEQANLENSQEISQTQMEESQENKTDTADTDSADDVQDSAAQNDADKSSSAARSSQMEQAKQAVEKLVAPYGGNVAVVVKPLDGNTGFSINGNEQFASASMIKLLLLVEYLEEVDAGTINPNTIYTRNNADVVVGTGQIQNDAAGTTYTYDTLARYMIKYSDNTATNVLIDKIGFQALESRAVKLGLTETQFRRKMMQSATQGENYTSAQDIATILYGIANELYLTDAQSSKAKAYLLEQTDNVGLAQGLPSGISFAHKTGTLTTVRHDGGIVYAKNPYVIVVLTKSLGDEGANSLMSKISQAVYEEIE